MLLGQRVIAAIEINAAENDVSNVIGVVELDGAARAFERSLLSLLPKTPVVAVPLVETGEREARVSSGKARVDLERAAEERARLLLLVRGAAADAVEAAQPALIGLQVVDRPAAGLRQHDFVDAQR